jgi:hypothetical protein
VATAVVIAATSMAVATLAGVLSRLTWRPGDVVLPWGLLLAVGASAGAVVLARCRARALGFAAAGGWIVGLGALMYGRPEGDYVIASDLLGKAFLVLATVSVLVAAVWRGVPQGGTS